MMRLLRSWFFRRPRAASHRHWRLENLEPRWAMAAPQINWSSSMMVDVNVAEISGYVTDDSPQSVSVRLSGAVTGSAAVDSSGYFQFRGPVSAPGAVSLFAT